MKWNVTNKTNMFKKYTCVQATTSKGGIVGSSIAMSKCGSSLGAELQTFRVAGNS